MRPDHIYKILQLSEWRSFQSAGHFDGSPIDHQDGFIHMSTARQVQGTLDKHYTKGAELILAQIISGAVKGLKYEVSRGGEDFPHIYGKILMDAVSQHWRLRAGENGLYDASRVLP